MAYVIHGAALRHRKLYRVWNTMKQRCLSDKNPMYAIYGGRGIKICNEWMNPAEFVEWAIKNGYAEGLSLDRINPDDGYSPQNCRFITPKQQNRNRRKHRMITFQGIARCMGEWAEITGIPAQNIAVRLDRCGWTVERALTEAPIPRKKRAR